MTNLERLKLELANKKYFSDEEYGVFLEENGLDPTVEYHKNSYESNLLQSVVSVLEAIANDTDLMMRIQTEMGTTSDAYQWLSARLNRLNERIAIIQEEENSEYEEYSPFSLTLTRGGTSSRPSAVMKIYDRHRR